MIFIIDGTGETADKTYMADMSRGFCYQLYLKLGRQAEYMRGPRVDGLNTFDIADEMLEKIMNYYHTGTTGPMFIDPNNRPKDQKLDDIFLAGHSRGGCAVIYIAQKLKEKGIKVKAMFLFDAVARTHRGVPIVGEDFDEIPDNVEKCYHAIRDRTLVDYYKKPLQLLTNRCQKVLPTANGVVIFTNTTTGVCRDLPALIEKDSKNKSLTRTEFVAGEKTFDFGNCGTKPHNDSRLDKKEFKGHHGTMGGAITATSPLKEQKILAPNDKDLTFLQEMALKEVDHWMTANLLKHGILIDGIIHHYLPDYALRYTKSANSTVC